VVLAGYLGSALITAAHLATLAMISQRYKPGSWTKEPPESITIRRAARLMGGFGVTT
jgi:hypothetical protein